MKMGGVPNWFWLSAEQVVQDSWKAAKAGKALSIPGRQYKVLSFITRFAPRPLVRKVGMNVRVRQRRK
jgi:short-subunit dehydrogenase